MKVHGEKERITPKCLKHTHDPDLIAKAIESVKTGCLTMRQAAKEFKGPFSTLNDKIVGKTLFVVVWGPVKYVTDLVKTDRDIEKKKKM